MSRSLPMPLIRALALAVLPLVAACSSKLAVGSFEIAGGPEMNGGGNAALVRVYQLNDDDAFRTVPLEAFWAEGPAPFEPALTAEPQEVLVYPEERQQIDLTLSPTTRYVGVAADLRRPKGDEWRVVYPVTDLVRRSLEVTIADDQLVLNTTDGR